MDNDEKIDKIVINTSNDDAADTSIIVDKDTVIADFNADDKDDKDGNDDSNDGNDSSDDTSGTDDGTSDELEAIEVDGVKYTINETGDAIDAEGTVKFTKTELDALEELESNGLSKLIEDTSLVPVDTEGKPIKYDNSPESVAKYVNDVYEQARRDETNNVFSSLYSKYPVLKNIITHLELNNGDFDGFNDIPSYTDVTIDTKNEDQMKNIIFQARKARGEDVVKSERYYTYLKDSDTDLKAVIAESKDELSFLQAQDAEREAANANAIAQNEADSISNANEYWGIDVTDKGKIVDLKIDGSVYDIVTKGKLKIGEETYTIPDKIRIKNGDKVEYKSRADLFKYIYQPVNQIIEGTRVTQTMYSTDLQNAANKRTTQDDTFDALKMFVKYDTSQFIKEQISQTKAKSVRRSFVTNKGTKRTGGGIDKIVIN